MKVICLSCGFSVQLGDAYDDYEGLVRCSTCKGVLRIRTIGGNLKSMGVPAPPESRESSPAEAGAPGEADEG